MLNPPFYPPVPFTPSILYHLVAHTVKTLDLETRRNGIRKAIIRISDLQKYMQMRYKMVTFDILPPNMLNSLWKSEIVLRWFTTFLAIDYLTNWLII